MASYDDAILRQGREKYVPPVKLNNGHSAALKRAGVKRFRLYDLRHTFGNRQGELGADQYALRDLLGHSGLDMLKRYVHPSDEHKRMRYVEWKRHEPRI